MNTKEFKDLQAHWYNILRDDGFEDVEHPTSKALKSYQDTYPLMRRSTANIAAQYTPETAQYYQFVKSFLHNGPKITSKDRIIMRLHAEGTSLRKISAYLRRHCKYPRNYKPSKPKPYSHFYVYGRLKKLRTLLAHFIAQESYRDDDELEINILDNNPTDLS